MCAQSETPLLRPATNNDCQAAAALIAEVLTEYGLPLDPEGIDSDVRDIESAYNEKGGRFYVLQARDGSIVGTVAIFPMSQTECELRKMYLARSHRGMGLGRLLLDRAIADAREMGFAEMTLETATVLKEAIALYESYGFTPYQSDHICFRCDRTYRLTL